MFTQRHCLWGGWWSPAVFFNKSCCVILKWIAGGRNGWIIFSKHKEVFWKLKIWKKKKSFQKLQIFKHRVAPPSHLSCLHWEVFLGRSSRETELCRRAEMPDRSWHSRLPCTLIFEFKCMSRFLYEIEFDHQVGLREGNTPACVYICWQAYQVHLKSLLVSCYKGLFRNSCHWQSLIKDSQRCDFPEERGPWFGELSNLSLSIETGCRRKHSSCLYFCSLNLSPSNTSFSQSFKRVKVTPCTGAFQALCWPRERRGARFPCL